VKQRPVFAHVLRRSNSTLETMMASSARIQRIAVVTVALSTLFACGEADSHHGMQRADSAGVEIVTYEGPDVTLGWRFELAFTLGGKETDEESFYELSGAYVGVDGTGNIYVLDTSGKRVMVFDADGGFLRSMGSEGGGPGEVRFPFALGVSPSGVASVFDISKRGMVRFDSDGATIEEIRVTFPYGGGPIVDRDGTLVFPVQELDPESATFTDRLLAISGADTVRIVSNVRPAGGTITLESCGMRLQAIPPVFSPTLRWSPSGDGVAVVTTSEYDIAFYRRDTLARLLRRPLTPPRSSHEVAVATIGDGMRVVAGSGMRICDPEEVVEQRGIAETIPLIGSLTPGPGGTLWVRRSAGPGAPEPIDVFDQDGTYLGTLPDRSPFPVAVSRERIIAIQTDDMDVDRLAVYRIVTDADG